ncbi:Lysophosphatidylcholine acyltransferase 1 [Merluccius polli]|uniref:Lysophosphatidylcholine acyltransferase 1 n=1 Tax=Merluccius polli TaxID=89951 RepID=A0AA47N838_MERPO|nr:Lysophosphatidylcholine acyltransferase 1 [Merluccius polli]
MKLSPHVVDRDVAADPDPESDPPSANPFVHEMKLDLADKMKVRLSPDLTCISIRGACVLFFLHLSSPIRIIIIIIIVISWDQVQANKHSKSDLYTRLRFPPMSEASSEIGLMSVTVFPVRLLLAAFLMLLAWPFAFAASLGRSNATVEPQSWWRRLVDVALRVIMRAMWFCAGFQWVRVKGQRAPPSQVPILTMAPHSTYFDAIPVTMTMSSIVTKLESQSIPVWGTLISYIRPVLVFRTDQDSRRKTVEEIKRRAHSSGQWPQIMIFPEGTCTNRSGVIRFKPGAFIPGLPVQPVVLRYPNKLDTVTWTWKGPGAFKILWLTLCQLHNSIEIEYLPVYVPSEEEKSDPALFANNVRQVMAKALQLPLTELSLEDLQLSLSQGPLSIPRNSSLMAFNRLICRLGLRATTSDTELTQQARRAGKLWEDRLSLDAFALHLGLPYTDTLSQIHKLFDERGDGKIDVRQYVIALSAVCRLSGPMDTLKLAFEMYEVHSEGEDAALEDTDVAAILEAMLGVRGLDFSELLSAVQPEPKRKITYAGLRGALEREPDLVRRCMRRCAPPLRHTSSASSNGQPGHKKHD